MEEELLHASHAHTQHDAVVLFGRLALNIIIKLPDQAIASTPSAPLNITHVFTTAMRTECFLGAQAHHVLCSLLPAAQLGPMMITVTKQELMSSADAS
jgi:hypothetical protein